MYRLTDTCERAISRLVLGGKFFGRESWNSGKDDWIREGSQRALILPIEGSGDVRRRTGGTGDVVYKALIRAIPSRLISFFAALSWTGGRLEAMSGSGKPLLGLWLYRSGEDWSYKEDCPIPTTGPHKVKMVKISVVISNWDSRKSSMKIQYS